MKHLRSLREFLGELEKIGELQPIDKEVDWKLEIGAVARRSYELRAPPLCSTPSPGSMRASGCSRRPAGCRPNRD